MNTQLSEKAQFMMEFLDLPKAAQIDDVSWETFQILLLNNTTRFGIDVKSRQIAWSFTAACDAVADGLLVPETPHVFVSINQDEAKEKIRYARAIVAALDEPVRPTLVRNSQLELEFDNGSRLISHPCRPPRGKPRARIYLDEMAHYKEGLDRHIYRAALPATTKGDGYMRIGSSPLGARGLFWEIATEALRGYPGYENNRRFIPWWLVRYLCRDSKTAQRMCPGMVTHDRVHAFGSAPLVEIFENMFLEDFQQEYECDWVDETVSWIPWDIIQDNQQADLVHWAVTSARQAKHALPFVARSISTGKVEKSLYAGVDIGRRRNLTELVIVGQGGSRRLPLRFMASLAKTKYDDQLDVLRAVLNTLPIKKMLIDGNSYGSQMAETLVGEFPDVVEGVDFSNPNKEAWAVEARIQAERAVTPLPPHRDLAYQIHSIKKKVTAAKNNVFDAGRNEKHHADKFWAWALGIWAASIKGSSAWILAV